MSNIVVQDTLAVLVTDTPAVTVVVEDVQLNIGSVDSDGSITITETIISFVSGQADFESIELEPYTTFVAEVGGPRGADGDKGDKGDKGDPGSGGSQQWNEISVTSSTTISAGLGKQLAVSPTADTTITLPDPTLMIGYDIRVFRKVDNNFQVLVVPSSGTIYTNTGLTAWELFQHDTVTFNAQSDGWRIF